MQEISVKSISEMNVQETNETQPKTVLSKNTKIITIVGIAILVVGVIVCLVLVLTLNKGSSSSRANIYSNSKENPPDTSNKTNSSSTSKTTDSSESEDKSSSSNSNIPDSSESENKSKTDQEKIDEIKEKVETKKYQENIFYRYRSQKVTNVKEEKKTAKGQSSLNQNSEFFLHVKEKYNETNEPTWYSGYFGILNMTLNNGSQDNVVILDKDMYSQISEFYKDDNERRMLEEVNNQTFNICFVKLDFFENGTIKNILYPKGFAITNYVYLEELINLVIPVISSHVFTNSSEHAIDKVKSAYKENTFSELLDSIGEFFEDLIDSIEDFFSNLFLKKINQNRRNLNTVIIQKKRTLADNQTNNEEEEYLTESNTQAQKFESDSYQVEPLENDKEKGEKNNVTIYTLGNIESKEAQFDNSSSETQTNLILDQNGIVHSVIEYKNYSLINNQAKNISSNKMYDSEIYDDNNQIKLEDIKRINKESPEPEQENPFTNVSGINTFSINNITIFNYTQNQELNSKLEKFYETFEFLPFDKNEYEVKTTKLRIMNEKKRFMKENNLKENEVEVRYIQEKPKLRNLETSIPFYGLKISTFEKNLFNYAFLGLQAIQKVYCETDPEKGTTLTYFVTKFGNINKKVKVNEQYSNMPIVVQNTNQMGFNFIKLLYETNKALTGRNVEYTSSITSFMKNAVSLFDESSDFSNSFIDSLNNIYHNIKTKSQSFYSELNDLVNKAYDNSTALFSQINSNLIIKQIKEKTKTTYTNAIDNAKKGFEAFQRNTSSFLEKVLNEVNNIGDNSIIDEGIDVIYDLIDSYSDSKSVSSNINKNLFSLIEKKLTESEYDIGDNVSGTINDLLKTTDSLFFNIGKEGLISDLFDETTKDNLKGKLKNFRNIFISIKDNLFSNITKEYQVNKESEQTEINKNISKYDKINEDTTNSIINVLKSKITNISVYESFTNHINNINSLSSKIIVDFIDDISSNTNLSRLSEDLVSNNNSILVKSKNKFINITKNIIQTIKDDINNANNYLKQTVEEFKEKNIYTINSNFRQIKQLFSNNNTGDFLEKEYFPFLKKVINESLFPMIKSNYELIYQYLKREEDLFNEHSKFKCFIGKGFVNTFSQMKSKFNDILISIQSDSFLEAIKNNCFSSKDKISQIIKDKLNKINKYSFDSGIYKSNFYFVDKIMEELPSISEKVTPYFEDSSFNSNIKKKFEKLYEDEIVPYHNKLIQSLDDYYNKVLKRANSTSTTKDDDEDFVYTHIISFTFFHYSLNNTLSNNLTNNIDKFNTNMTSSLYLQPYNASQNFGNNSNIEKIQDLIQSMYTNINEYFNNKINNNSNVQKVIEEYESLLKTNITNNYSYFINQENNYNELNLNDTIFSKIKKNIQSVEEYITTNIVNEYDKLDEYPEEIYIKLEETINKLTSITDSVKEKMNLRHKNNMITNANSTYQFLSDIINNNLKYALSNIDFNSEKITDSFLSAKKNIISKAFNGFINKLETTKTKSINNIEKKDVNQILFNTQNYDESKNEIKSSLQKFLDNFKTKMKGYFPDDIKTNNSFSTFKLRTDIYNIKSSIINSTNNFIDEFDFNNLINFDMIKNSDETLNDKDIVYLYNETISKINKINTNNSKVLEESYQNIINKINKKYSYKNDFSYFVNKIKKNTGNFSNNNNNTNFINFENADEILKEIKDVLNQQMTLIKRYQFYNFNETNFKNFYTDRSNKIIELIDSYGNNISFNISCNLYERYMKVMKKLESEKREYYKTQINEYTKKYNIKLFNLSYDIGEKVKSSMEEEFTNFECNSNDDFIDEIETLSNKYNEYAKSEIAIKKNNILNSYTKLFDEFINNLSNNSNPTVDINYVKDQVQIDPNECLNFTYENTSIKRFLDQKETESKSPDNEEVINIESKTKCYNSEYMYFDTFNIEYMNKLINLTQKFKLLVNNDNSINTTDDYSLEDYKNLNLSDLDTDFDYLKEKANYESKMDSDSYKKILSDSLIYSINNSFSNYINNYLVNDISDKFTIRINNKIKYYLEYISKVISDKGNYYQSILTKSSELGNNTKTALLNLYDTVYNNVNKSLSNFLENDIGFYLSKFTQKNIESFRNMIINSYTNGFNNYDIKIFKIGDLIEEIINNREFNQSINELENKQLTNIFINKIKANLSNSISTSLSSLLKDSQNLKTKMETFIQSKFETIKTTTNQFLKNIKSYVEDFNDIINTNKNKIISFSFDTKETNNLLSQFIKEIKESSILSIDKKTEENEKNISYLVGNITFDNSTLKKIIDSINLNSKVSFINSTVSNISNKLKNYFKLLYDETDGYVNKLIHYTYIQGNNYLDKPCNESACLINLNSSNSSTLRALEENNLIPIRLRKLNDYSKFKDIKNKINKKIDFRRKLVEYNSKSGAVTQNDVISYLLNIQETIGSFNKTYLGSDYTSFLSKSNTYLNVNLNSSMSKMKNYITLTSYKFSNIGESDSAKNVINVLNTKLLSKYNDMDGIFNNSYGSLLSSITSFQRRMENQTTLFASYFDLIYNKSTSYYSKMSNLIQKKLVNMNITQNASIAQNAQDVYVNLRSFILETKKETESTFNNTIFESIFNQIVKSTVSEETSSTISKYASKVFDVLEKNYINITRKCFKKKFKYTFSYPFPTFPFVGLQIIPSLSLGACLELGLKLPESMAEDDGFSIVVDVSGNAGVSLALAVALGLPTSDSSIPVSVSISAGVEGQLISAVVGVKCNFFLGKNKVSFSFYYIFEAVAFRIFISYQVKLLFTEKSGIIYEYTKEGLQWNGTQEVNTSYTEIASKVKDFFSDIVSRRYLSTIEKNLKELP